MAIKKSEEQDPLYREIGNRIREARAGKLTQDELAEKISMDRSSISNIELGRQKLFAHTLFQIALVLGVSPAHLLPEESPSHMANDAIPDDVPEVAHKWIQQVREQANQLHNIS
ncbi:MAG: helix-turn-helix transcriptional regulator [Planctomycetaceae bacterium]|nr:helix-turn-helix transcriptional regulator [Planctomycetaceae bacterium]